MEVTISLGLDDAVGQRYAGRGDDGPEYEPVTLADAIVARAATIFLEALDKDALAEARRRTEGITDEEIRARVGPLIQDALEQRVQPTLSGPPLLLSEHVVAVARRELSGARSSGSTRQPLLVQMIQSEVERTLKGELKSALDEAKAQVRAAVMEKGAEVLAETIERMAAAR